MTFGAKKPGIDPPSSVSRVPTYWPSTDRNSRASGICTPSFESWDGELETCLPVSLIAQSRERVADTRRQAVRQPGFQFRFDAHAVKGGPVFEVEDLGRLAIRSAAR